MHSLQMQDLYLLVMSQESVASLSSTFHPHHDKFSCKNGAVIYPRHVEGKKLDRAVWNLSTFHAYVNYHVKVRSFKLLKSF